MASPTPAELTGTAHEIGSLETNKLADIVVLSPQLDVTQVYIGGKSIRAGAYGGGRAKREVLAKRA